MGKCGPYLFKIVEKYYHKNRLSASSIYDCHKAAMEILPTKKAKFGRLQSTLYCPIAMLSYRYYHPFAS